MNTESRRTFLFDGMASLLGLNASELSADEECIDSVSRISSLKERDDQPGTVLFVEGYHEPQDGGGGFFVRYAVDETSAEFFHPRAKNALWVHAPDRGGPWVRVVSTNDPFNVKWFGARGDGTTDAAKAINDAIWMSGLLNVRQTHIPAGRYRIASPIVFRDTFGHTLTGDGPMSTILEKKGDGTAETSLSEEPIDATIILPVIVREKPDGGKRTITPHSTTIRDMRIRGTDADESEPFDRDYGIYIERTQRASFENLVVNKFDCAFFAHQIFMSCLQRLWSKHIRNFIDISSSPAHNKIAKPRTSLTIRNCYCSNEVRGDGFRLRAVSYSTLQNCGADRVQGTPYDIHACRGVNLIGCGFERSKSGRGIRFRGSSGTIIGTRTYRPEVPDEDERSVSLLEVRTLDWGRTSSVTVIGSDFANYKRPTEEASSDRDEETPSDPIAANVFDRIVDSGSTLTVIATRFPRNARPYDTVEATDRGRVVEVGKSSEEREETVLDPQRAKKLSNSLVDRTDGKVKGTLSPVSGTDDDSTINDNIATLNAKIDRLLDALSEE